MTPAIARIAIIANWIRPSMVKLAILTPGGGARLMFVWASWVMVLI
jgi:hypothetical protein